MPRKAFTEHPMFLIASGVANRALSDAASAMGGPDCKTVLSLFESDANRAADALTRLLLKAHDASSAAGRG
jgi:hypothetical protein